MQILVGTGTSCQMLGHLVARVNRAPACADTPAEALGTLLIQIVHLQDHSSGIACESSGQSDSLLSTLPACCGSYEIQLPAPAKHRLTSYTL